VVEDGVSKASEREEGEIKGETPFVYARMSRIRKFPKHIVF